MMETRGRAESSRRVPAGLAGMLVLVAVAELVIGGRRLDFTTVWAEDWRRTAEAASTKALGRDVLCFGDSLVKYGVLPRVIEARTGLTGFNLAINAGPLPAQYYLLKRALASGARPRGIVADFFALMLPDQPMGSIRLYPELASLGDSCDLARTVGDGDLLAALLLGKWLPSVRCRFEIRARIVAACCGRPVASWWANRRVWQSWQDQLGAQPMAAPPGGSAAIPGLVADLTPPHWAVDPINATYFERFVALAEAHRIPVFWIMPPLGAEVRAGRVARGTDEAYTRFAREAQRGHPGLIVLDARAGGADASTHIDPIHLNDRAATVLSGDIARAVAAHLGARTSGRWVDLPRFAGRTGAAPGPPRSIGQLDPGSQHR